MILDYQERLRKAKANQSDSNCIGTALYLSGLRSEDGYYSTRKVYNDYLMNLEEIDDPRKGSLVAWLNVVSYGVIQVPHMGIITIERPPCVTHRVGREDEILTNHSLIRLNTLYDGIFDYKFYNIPEIV
jgi:hypothetical protein